MKCHSFPSVKGFKPGVQVVQPVASHHDMDWAGMGSILGPDLIKCHGLPSAKGFKPGAQVL